MLLPATKLGQGYIFTGVCDSVHGGGGWGLPQCMLGYHPPGQGTPLGAGTPQEQAHPPDWAPTLAHSMLGDTVNARAVRILLECNLVLLGVYSLETMS